MAGWPSPGKGDPSSCMAFHLESIGVRPLIWSAVRPRIASAAGLEARMVPSASWITTPNGIVWNRDVTPSQPSDDGCLSAIRRSESFPVGIPHPQGTVRANVKPSIGLWGAAVNLEEPSATHCQPYSRHGTLAFSDASAHLGARLASSLRVRTGGDYSAPTGMARFPWIPALPSP